MTPIELAEELNELINKVNPKSVLDSLQKITISFGLLLDIYAMPNPNNPQGMCESKEDFRIYFAQLLIQPAEVSLRKKRRKYLMEHDPNLPSERYTLDSILQEKRTLRAKARYLYLRLCVFATRIEWSEVGYFIACVLLMALFFYLYGKRVEQ